MKHIKKIILFLVLAVAVIIFAIFAYFKLTASQEFAKHREIAVSYVEKTYAFKARIVDEAMGETSYPIGRESDCFLFYDETNQLYFKIYVYDEQVADYYLEATKEKPDMD